MDPLLLSLAAFLGVAGLVGIVVYLVGDFGGSPAEDRLAVMTGQKSAEETSGKAQKQEIVREGFEGLSGMVNEWLGRLGNLGLLFEQAESPVKPDVFLLLSGVTAVVSMAVALLVSAPVVLLPIAAITGGFFPLGWLLWRRGRRFKKFAEQLPDALELISRALRSGHSLASGLRVVVEEMPPPIANEFEMAYEEQNLGMPIETALKSMLRRMPNLDLKFFVTSVAIQRQAGGDLAEILDKISGIIRERFKIMGQVKALTGEGRISGIILMALPIAIFFAVYYLNPDYVMRLFTDELGKKMIAVAVVMQLIGAVVIKKIINIKV